MGFFTRTTSIPEPTSSEQRFQRLKTDIHRQLVEMLDVSQLGKWKQERLQRELQGLAETLISKSGEKVAEGDRERLHKDLMSEIFGLGPLDRLMNDPTINDILVNGPNQIFIDRNGRLEPTEYVFANDQHLLQVIQRVVARIGRRVDESSPMVDARLPDGSRINAVIPPLSLQGPVLSIRRFSKTLDADALLANGTFVPEILQLLTAAVQGRISMLISGGTGTGKTTLLNILSKFVPPGERLITIEDSAELRLKQAHVVRLETRPANTEGSGEVRQRELVRNALRMRPDRIIIGEVRGAEALDMLQAMNTGHEGSLTTIHANDTRDALTRLEMMVMMAGYEMPVSVIRQYVGSAISLVVQMARLRGGERRIVRISEILGSRKNRYGVRDIFKFEQTGVEDGKAVGRFLATGYQPRFLKTLHAAGVDLPTELFAQRTLAFTPTLPEETANG